MKNNFKCFSNMEILKVSDMMWSVSPLKKMQSGIQLTDPKGS